MAFQRNGDAFKQQGTFQVVVGETAKKPEPKAKPEPPVTPAKPAEK